MGTSSWQWVLLVWEVLGAVVVVAAALLEGTAWKLAAWLAYLLAFFGLLFKAGAFSQVLP